MLKIKKILAALCLPALLVFTFLPGAASAQVSEIKCGANSAATGDCSNSPGGPTLHDIIVRIINIVSSLVAVASVIMIMVGGFRYVTSGGDSARVGTAKSTITNALIGLVIAVFAQVIVRFVLSKVQ
jgi:hypothetical protein